MTARQRKLARKRRIARQKKIDKAVSVVAFTGKCIGIVIAAAVFLILFVAVVEEIKKNAVVVGNNFDKIEQVATISANNDKTIGQLIASAMEKVGKDGVITVTMANLSADKPATVTLDGTNAASVAGRILKGEMHQYNDFGDAPLAVEAFDGCVLKDGKIEIELPACCVAEITIK